jgi:hypothetical protein
LGSVSQPQPPLLKAEAVRRVSSLLVGGVGDVDAARKNGILILLGVMILID